MHKIKYAFFAYSFFFVVLFCTKLNMIFLLIHFFAIEHAKKRNMAHVTWGVDVMITLYESCCMKKFSSNTFSYYTIHLHFIFILHNMYFITSANMVYTPCFFYRSFSKSRQKKHVLLRGIL